jgi:hypothetical protein
LSWGDEYTNCSICREEHKELGTAVQDEETESLKWRYPGKKDLVPQHWSPNKKVQYSTGQYC